MITGRKGRPPASAEADTDWFKARIRELNLTQNEVAAALRRDPSVITRSLKGERQFDAQDVASLSRLLKVSTDEVLRRMGVEIAEQGVPVVGRITGDAKVSTVSNRKGNLVQSLDMPPGAQALVVEADKGPLAAYHGASFIFAAGDQPLSADAFGRLCVVEADDELLPLLGTLGKAHERGRVSLEIFETGQKLTVAKVHRASPVVAIFLA